MVEIVNDEEGRPPQWRAGWQGGDTGVVPGCWRSLLECGGCGAARCGGGVQLLGFEVNRSALVGVGCAAARGCDALGGVWVSPG